MRTCVDRIARDRIFFFMLAVDFFLLVGLLSMVGWLDPVLPKRGTMP